MTGTVSKSVGRQRLFGGGKASVGGGSSNAPCWRFLGPGLTKVATEESATEEGDGAEVGAFLFRGRLGLVCGSVVGEAGLFLDPFDEVGKGASRTTTGGADEGPGTGPRAFFLTRALVVVAGGAPGSAGTLILAEGSNRAWRSGLPTTGVCLASNLMYGLITSHKARIAVGPVGSKRNFGTRGWQCLHCSGSQRPRRLVIHSTWRMHRE